MQKRKENNKESYGYKKKEVGKNKGGQKTFYKSTAKKDTTRNKSGKIVRKRNHDNELIGIYKQGQGAFGFVDTVNEKTGEKKGYFTHESKKLDAFEGDEVAFEVQHFKGREEAQITKVLKRSEHLIVGTLKVAPTYAFVVSKNPLIKSDIFIPGKHIGGYTDGSEVAVQIIKWEGKNPEGRIVESLGNLPKGREDIYKIAFEMGARKSFSEAVIKETKDLKSFISESDLKYRKDCRDLLTYTIDGAESKDLDDAISLEVIYETPPVFVPQTSPSTRGNEKASFVEGGGRRSEGVVKGYILYVHIADVSHYVREDTPLDREARKRGTSIYLADQVIPMLPTDISNGLCSLHPGEDKLTLTCEIHISKSGQVTKSEVYNSVITSDYRLTYKEIDEFVGGEIKSGDELLFGEKITDYLLENIQNLKILTDILSKNTENRGSLDFDFPETKIVLDDAGNPIEYKKLIRYDSYKIIEECMVLANESVSKLYQKYPFLYRIHEDPDGEDVEKFTKMLETIVPVSDIPGDFPGILALLQSDIKLQYLQKLLLRSLSKALYSEKNLGHFGLALKFYSHFTSPIRRYPDLQIHRIIKEIITPPPASQVSPSTRGNEKASFGEGGGRRSEGVINRKFTQERRDYYDEILPKIARRSSDTADRSEKMEYKVRDMLACKYMADKVGNIFTANISGMIEKGFFVELPDTIEGFVDYGMTGLSYNSERMLLEDTTGKELHFGSEVQVKLIDIDEMRKRLEFELV